MSFIFYFSHLILSSLDEIPSQRRKDGEKKKKYCQVLGTNSEKIRSFKIGSYRISDSIEHLPKSLDDLTRDLVQAKSNFTLLDQIPYLPKPVSKSDPNYKLLEKDRNELKSLLLKKGVFPYEWVTSMDKLKAATSLPRKEEFYSRLRNSGISDADYDHAKNVWNRFKIKTMREYLHFYNLLVGLIWSFI